MGGHTRRVVEHDRLSNERAGRALLVPLLCGVEPRRSRARRHFRHALRTSRSLRGALAQTSEGEPLKIPSYWATISGGGRSIDFTELVITALGSWASTEK